MNISSAKFIKRINIYINMPKSFSEGLDEEIIKVCLKISKRGEGALIIVTENKNLKYKPLVEQTVPSFNILKDPKIIMQIDTLEKGIEKKVSEISHILEGVGVGTIGTIGAGIIATSVGFAGITFIPGVIVFGGAYYLMKKLKEREGRR